MPDRISTLIIGGTSGIGRAIAHALARRGEEVIVTGRDKERAQAAAAEIGSQHHGLALDLTRPEEIGDALATVGPIDHLVLAAVERDQNSVRGYDIGRAIKLLTLKVVGYTAVVHALAPRFSAAASIVILGGMARDWPYPGSTTVTMANGDQYVCTDRGALGDGSSGWSWVDIFAPGDWQWVPATYGDVAEIEVN